MAVMVQGWERLGPYRIAAVCEDDRLVGRIVDLGMDGFRADYITTDGEFLSEVMPDYYSAVMLVAEYAWTRKRRLN